jgi:hypothetical protein
MSFPYLPDHRSLPSSPPTDWPEARFAEWCALHRLIEELSAVQRRLGTPLELPRDISEVRNLGASIGERLEQLGPWLEQAVGARESN